METGFGHNRSLWECPPRFQDFAPNRLAGTWFDRVTTCGLRSLSGGPPASLAGSGADRGWGVPPNPHQRGLRPLWTLPPDTHSNPWREAERTGVGDSAYAPTKGGCALSRLSRRTSTQNPGGKQSGQGLGVPPMPPPKGAAPSLDSPAGHHSKLRWREAERTGVGGFRQCPHQRALRPLWTLPPDTRLLRWREGEREGLGVSPMPPPTRLRPLWTLPQGGEPVAWLGLRYVAGPPLRHQFHPDQRAVT